MTPKKPTGSVPPGSRLIVGTLVFIGLVVAAIGSLGAPLIPTVARHDGVSPAAAQWTLTIALLSGALATPVLARLGEGPQRRRAILATLVIVAMGSLATVLPIGFGGLLAGRALQGIGVGLTSLVIGVARDALPAERSGSVIGLLSVTSVAGIGLGYPLAGVLTRYGGLTLAYGAGLLVALGALALGAAKLPPQVDRPPVAVDARGVMLLGCAVTGVLVAASESSAGVLPAWVLGALGLVSLGIGGVWVRHELVVEHPLVDLRLLQNPAVAIADASVLIAGMGLYLLMSLSSRYVQTPTGAGYGVHGSVITAGLVLVPFSGASFLGSRVAARVPARIPKETLIPIAGGLVLVAALLFASARASLWNVLLVMGITGAGVGLLFATIPAMIVAAIPAAQTTGAVGFNQVARTVGVTAGSALCGIILQAATPAGQAIPRSSGYTTAALIAAAALVAMIAAATLALIRTRRQSRSTAPAVSLRGVS
jgi:predicted MFS family arabinose efflux permease